LVGLYTTPESTEEIRWRIVYVFGNRELPESLPLLVEALQDPSWLIHNEAAVGLSRMKEEKVIPELDALLKSGDARLVKDVKWVEDKIKANSRK
jgi:HEAT repeat protein